MLNFDPLCVKFTYLDMQAPLCWKAKRRVESKAANDNTQAYQGATGCQGAFSWEGCCLCGLCEYPCVIPHLHRSISKSPSLNTGTLYIVFTRWPFPGPVVEPCPFIEGIKCLATLSPSQSAVAEYVPRFSNPGNPGGPTRESPSSSFLLTSSFPNDILLLDG